MKRAIGLLLLGAIGAFGQITTIPAGVGATGGVGGAGALTDVGNVPRVSSAGILGLSKLSCTLGTCTVYDDRATVGATTLVVRAGAGQSTTNLQEWKNAGGSNLVALSYLGGIIATSAEGTSGGFRVNDAGLTLGNVSNIIWRSSGSYYTGSPDLAASRLSAGNLEVTSGTTGKPAGLTVGSLTTVALSTPATPVITQGGTGGAASYGYKVACLAGDGTTTAASAEGTTATGNATLDGTNYNIITFTASTGSTTCDVFRTTGGATQGKIGNTATSPFNDTGLAASGSAPSANTTGRGLFAGNVGIGTTGAATNAVSYVQRLSHISSGTVAAGFGAGLEMELETATDGTNKVAATIETAWTTATAGAESSSIALNIVNAGAVQTAIKCNTVLCGFGGVTASYPGWKPSGATFQAKLGDDSDFTSIAASDFLVGSVSVVGSLNALSASTAELFSQVARKLDANGVTIDGSGVITPLGYKSADGTAGVTVTTCTGFKNGLCISGT